MVTHFHEYLSRHEVHHSYIFSKEYTLANRNCSQGQVAVASRLDGKPFHWLGQVDVHIRSLGLNRCKNLLLGCGGDAHLPKELFMRMVEYTLGYSSQSDGTSNVFLIDKLVPPD